MDTSHPDFLQPEDQDIPIWRYLSLEKFDEIVREGMLRLTRLDRFGDNHEASLTKGEATRANHMQNILGWSGRTYDGSAPEIFRQRLYASCCSMGKHESESMWKLFVPGNQGVVIKSTYRKLTNSIDDERIRIGCIEYSDYDNEAFSGFKGLSVAMRKRMEFFSEQEVRILALHEITDNNEYPSSIYLPWKMKETIETIIVNPYADDDFKLEVEMKLSKAGLNEIPVKWSQIRRDPTY